MFAAGHAAAMKAEIFCGAPCPTFSSRNLEALQKNHRSPSCLVKTGRCILPAHKLQIANSCRGPPANEKVIMGSGRGGSSHTLEATTSSGQLIASVVAPTVLFYDAVAKAADVGGLSEALGGGGGGGGGGEWAAELLFSAGQEANSLVLTQLSSLSIASLGVIFGAGLVTSLSPCTLSVLPLTIGYIGGYQGKEGGSSQLLPNSVAFSLGLATTLAALGVVASAAGKAYGQIGQGLPIAVSCVAILMGLNLLEVVPLQLPSFFGNFDARQAAAGLPSWVQAYLAGLTFALAASPCSTPVLASILAYVASTEDPVRGGGLLLAYTTGYVAPLLIAASFTGALKRLLSLRQFSKWINPVSGSLLLGGGIYSLLTRVVPDPSMGGMVM